MRRRVAREEDMAKAVRAEKAFSRTRLVTPRELEDALLVAVKITYVSIVLRSRRGKRKLTTQRIGVSRAVVVPYDKKPLDQCR